MATHQLSKSRFQTGLQCTKALWLATHLRELADPVPASRQQIFDTGTRVGELARQRFPGGVLVKEDYRHQPEAVRTTARLMQAGVPALFEAAFQFGGVLVRCDVLVRAEENGAENGAEAVWDLYEVKSSTQVKPEQVTDVAVQAWVLEGAGLTVRRTFVMHLNNTYVWDGGVYDLAQLFTARDVTADVRRVMPEVAGQVRDFLSMLDGPEPQVPIGRHCDTPCTCSFYGHCYAHLPDPPVTSLPRVTRDLLARLVEDGYLGVRDVPPDYPGLTPAQREVCALVRSGEAHTVGDLRGALARLRPPLHFLDFETFMPAVPVYPGTHPYHAIPFQWSNHVLTPDGLRLHREFLHQTPSDPRVAFVEALLAATADAGSVIVYSPYEQTQLSALAHDLPAYAEPIAALQARLFDLERVVRAHVRHPACLGRTSIKVVLPALVTDLSYDGLAIANGEVASRLYLQFMTGELPAEAHAGLFADLRAYCGTDTLAMVRLFEVLRG